MPACALRPSSPSFHFARFLSSGVSRAVARVLIVTLLLMDMPPRLSRAAEPEPGGVPLGSGVIHYVNGDGVCQGQSPCFSKIQVAIDAAQPGDTIRVQAGEYDEALKLKKKQQLILEADPTLPEGSVILNSVSQRCGRGDVITLDASTDITIRGFTITDAGGQAIEIRGGGVRRHNEHILIERNRIFGNGTSQCQGGIRVGPNTPDTVILNNLLYGNGQDAIRFLGGKGGPHYVVQNVIHGNRRDGINVTKGQTVVIVNNLITHNGTDPKPPTQLYGIRRPAPKKKGRAENAQLLHNLICGNRKGELLGPMLDGLDAGNLTPTGSEGPGVSANPQCADLSVVYANVDGPDGQPHTQDDDFTLAVGSPAVDAGIDPRAPAVDIPIATANLEQDFFREGVRPEDGDADGTPAFDIGAVEGPEAGPQCQPGTTQQCYDGTAGTQGVGICRGGTRTCQTDGTFGPCEGQVLPRQEVCDNGFDDDCNGQGLACPLANHPPTITSTPVTEAVAEQLYSYGVAAIDPDNGDVLTFLLDGAPAGMTIDVATGMIRWTPTTAQAGPRHVMVRVRDQGGVSAIQSFSIDVQAPLVNQPPTARDEQYVVRRGQTLTVPAPGVLNNDTDPENDALTAQLVASPTNGDLNLSMDGSFTYTPAAPLTNSTEPVLKFAFEHPNVFLDATYHPPLVVDLDKDGVAEIIALAQGAFGTRRLFAIHGNDGSLAFSINAFQPRAVTDPSIVLDIGSALATGDIDGDGFVEIIAVDGDDGDVNFADPQRRELHAFEHDGTHKWKSQDVESDPLVDSTSGFTKPLIANITGDDKPEIVVGYAGVGPTTTPSGAEFVTVFDNQGQILWTAHGAGSSEGLHPATGAVVAHDIDLNGDLEILFGDDVYDHQGNRLWSAATCGTCSPRVFDVAVANLDDDPFAEIVYLDAGGFSLSVYEHTGARKWGPLSLSASIGRAETFLTVGDADGDGMAEIVLASDDAIGIFERDGTLARSLPLPFAAVTGAIKVEIFDLNGDGRPEIIYHGRHTLYIFDGQSGALLHSPQVFLDRSHAPPLVIADVDGDGAAEIVVPSWSDSKLLYVFEAKNGQWAKARPVYNQFSYHVTNVNGDGTIPAREAINWLTPGLNNYRINIPLPEERTGDTDQFTYKANDGALDSNTATVKIDLLPPNSAPSILSQAPTTAAFGVEYLYPIRAFDPDAGEILTFSLFQAPAGMTIDSGTGLIRWTPTAGQLGNHVIAAQVADSQGESAFQGFTITVSAPVTVPNIVGQTQAAAQALLTNAGLTVGTVAAAPSSTVPVGQVVSQDPLAGTVVAPASMVGFVVSLGPVAEDVDDDGDGFNDLQGDCDDADANTKPGAIDLPDNGVDEDCRGGDAGGLDLTLSANVVGADSILSFVNTVRNPAGDIIDPPPALDMTLTAIGTPTGPTPTIVGNTIVIAPNTRSAFTVHSQVVGSLLSDEEQLTVLSPTAQNQQLSNLSQAGNTIVEGLRRAQRALQAGDDAAASSAKADLQTAGASIDVRRLSITAPFSPEGGFPLSPQQLIAVGRTPTAADGVFGDAMVDLLSVVDDLIAAIERLNPTNITNAQLANLHARANTLNALRLQLRDAAPSVYGITANANQLTLLLTRRLPTLLQLVGQKAVASLTAVGVAGLSGQPQAKSMLAAVKRNRLSAWLEQWWAGWRIGQLVTRMLGRLGPEPAQAQFLFDVAATMGLESELLDIAMDIYGDFIEEVEKAMLLVAADGLLRPFVASNVCAAVSSVLGPDIVAPAVPGSFVEGIGFNSMGELNQTLFIGPEAPSAVADLLESFDTSQIEDLSDVYDYFAGILDAFSGIAEAYDNASRTPSSVAPQQGFVCATNGDLLFYDEGFPDVLGDCSLCVSPILILHHDVVSGAWGLHTAAMVKE